MTRRILPAVQYESPIETWYSREETRAAVREALKMLKQKERLVISMRYGLAGDKQHTLQEIGDALGVTRERARQILVIATEKMKANL